MEKSAARKRLLVYLALVFGITYLYSFLVVVPKCSDPAFQAKGLATALVATVMLLPALCVIITRLVTKEGFRGMWLRLNLKKRWRYYVIAWFAPTLLTALGCVIYFLIFPQNFDPAFAFFGEVLASQGVELPAAQLKLVIFAQLAQSALLAPALNIVFCLGEELGWRGYMMPKLVESGVKVVPAVLIAGALWGLWHAPLIWGVGHNYGVGYAGYPWLGIFAMCLFCIVCGALFTWVTFKTRSCIPAALAHGALNGSAAIGIYMTRGAGSYDPFVGPAPTGFIGGAAYIIVAVIVTLWMLRDEKRGGLIYSPETDAPAPPAGPAVIPAGFTKDTFDKK